jgi:WD40 repeat protein
MTAMICVNNRPKGGKWTSKIWTGYQSGKVVIWSTSSIRKEQEISCHNSPVTSIVQAGDMIWTSSTDGTIRLWDVETLMPALYLEERTPVRCMILIACESEVWTASEDGTIKVRDAKNGNLITTLKVGQSITTLNMVYTNDHVWSCSDDGKLRIWDVATKALVRELKAHDQKVSSLCGTDKQVWSSSGDKIIHIFDAEGLKGLKKIRANNVYITSMIPVGNEHIFAVCSDKKIRVWQCAGDPVEQGLKIEEEEVETQVASSNLIKKPSSTGSLPVDKAQVKPLSSSLGGSTNNLLYPAHTFTQLPTDTFDLLRDAVDMEFDNVDTKQTEVHEDKELVNELSVEEISQLRMNVSNLLEAVKKEVPSPIKKNVGPSEAPLLEDCKYIMSEDDDDDSDTDDYEMSEDEGSTKHYKALVKEYEAEIVILRNQLQKSTTRAGKYKTKLQSSNLKLHDRDTEIAGTKMKYKHIQDELYNTRGEAALVTQDLEKLKSDKDQGDEEKEQLTFRLNKLYRELSGEAQSPHFGTDTAPTTMRTLDKLLLKIEMELSLHKFKAVSTPNEPIRGSEARPQSSQDTRHVNEEAIAVNAANSVIMSSVSDSLGQISGEISVSVDEVRSLLAGLQQAQNENTTLSTRLMERDAELAAAKQVILCVDNDKTVDTRLEVLTESLIEYAQELERQFSEREKVRKLAIDLSRNLGLEEGDFSVDVLPLLSSISKKVESSSKGNSTDIDGDVKMEARQIVTV